MPSDNGSVTLPSAATVQMGNGPELIVSGTGTTINPDGQIALPGGSIVQVGAGTPVTIPPAACPRQPAMRSPLFWSGIHNLSVFAVIPGSMVSQETSNPFADISDQDYFYEAVLWAVENGITSGTRADTFSPKAPCTRAQIVAFLFRAQV